MPFHRHLVNAAVALWLAVGPAFAGSMTLLGVGKTSGGSPFTPSCSQSSTFLAAATNVTLTADKQRYDTLICGLVSDGVWNFDVLYIWAAPDSATSLINLANPGTFNGTTHGTVSFSAYNGYTGDASTFYIDTGFNPTTATTPNFTQNNAAYGAYILSSRTTAQSWWALGDVAGSASNLFRPFGAGAGDAHLNDSTLTVQVNNTNAQGAYNISRTASTGMAAFTNSGENPTGTAADTSNAPANANLIFFAFSTGFGFTGDQMAAGWITNGVGNVTNGSGVNSCKINNRINTYMQTLTSPINVYSNSAC